MRQALIILAIAGAVLSPMSFAQSAQGSASDRSTADAGPASPDTAPVSKAHRAMASFDSLLREAALQSQAERGATRSPHLLAQPVGQPAQPAPEGRDAVASTPDPGSVH